MLATLPEVRHREDPKSSADSALQRLLVVYLSVIGERYSQCRAHRPSDQVPDVSLIVDTGYGCDFQLRKSKAQNFSTICNPEDLGQANARLAATDIAFQIEIVVPKYLVDAL
jgi:hypothetical protein